MPGARCTRGLVCTCNDRTHTSNNEYTGITRKQAMLGWEAGQVGVH